MFHTKTTQKHIKEMEIHFRKQVHNKNCRQIYTCPQCHPACNKELNYKTVLQWEVAMCLSSMRYCTKGKQQREILTTLRLLKSLLYVHASIDECTTLDLLNTKVISPGQKQINIKHRAHNKLVSKLKLQIQTSEWQ